MLHILDVTGLRRLDRQSLETGPRLNDGSSPRCVNESYRHIQVLLEIASVEITHSRETLCYIASTDVPAIADRGIETVEGLGCNIGLNLQEADIRVVIGIGYLFLGIVGSGEFEAHIGLTGAEPHLAYHHIVENGLCTIVDGDAIGAASLGSTHLNTPFTIGSCRSGVCLGVP